MRWRFFWQRIGNALYIASQRDVLTDLVSIQSKGGSAPANAGLPVHALVRLRPEHWNQVLEHYRLGWEENNRQACLHNLGPLSSLSRAITAARGATDKPLSDADLAQYAARLHDVRYFCPDGGKYDLSPRGAVTCNIHGSAAAPRQPASPAATSELGKLLSELSDMSLTLTFLEDGLHATIDLERK